MIKEFLNNKKGSAAVFLVAMCLIFFGMLFYNLFSRVNALSYNNTVDYLDTLHNNTFVDSAKSTMDILSVTWRGFIMVFVLGIILWALMSASKKEPTYYSG